MHFVIRNSDALQVNDTGVYVIPGTWKPVGNTPVSSLPADSSAHGLWYQGADVIVVHPFKKNIVSALQHLLFSDSEGVGGHCQVFIGGQSSNVYVVDGNLGTYTAVAASAYVFA